MLTILIGLLLAVTATPRVVEQREYYAVRGSSENELRSALNRLRPRDAKGEAHDAITRWDVRWEYRYASAAGNCALTSFSTSVEVVMTIPRWANREAGSPLAARWERYITALEAHERGHAEIVIRAAKAIQERLSALEPVPTCQALEASIKAKGEALLDEHRREEVEFDRRTEHGMREGARFP